MKSRYVYTLDLLGASSIDIYKSDGVECMQKKETGSFGGGPGILLRGEATYKH